MTSHLWKIGLVVCALAGLASEAAAQGRSGGRAPGGGRCGGGMNTQMQGSRGATPTPSQQSYLASARAYQQQTALRAYQTQLQLARYQQAQQPRLPQTSSGTMMVSLATASPRQGTSSASDRSPEWTTEYAVEPPVRTVTPGKAPVALAVNPPAHLAYSIAASANLTKTMHQSVAAGEVVLLDAPLSVHVETTVRGLAYVRPTEGRYKGKFFVVDERYVK